MRTLLLPSGARAQGPDLRPAGLLSMFNRRVSSWMLCALCATAAAPAEAQYRQLSDPATGEKYNIEVSYGVWNPSPDMVINVAGFGIPGTDIDFVNDLGIEKKKFNNLKVTLRPARKHKFRIEFIPIKYTVDDVVLRKEIIFNGQRYNVGLPVNAEAKWNAWRFAYEYDFIYRDRGFLGVVAEAKYTDVRAEFASPVTTEFARARAPIPAIGLIGRGYVARNVSLTGEFTMFRLLNREEDKNQGSYYDFDLYGTINFTNNVGAQVGYRSLDVSYLVDLENKGDFKLNGVYFSGVVRF